MVMKRSPKLCGTKRKIPIKKIEKKTSLAVAYTKRSGGLYSKASQLCLLDGSQIAILASPPSSESSVSFYSFGHSSVDAVVSAYLSGQRLLPVPSETEKQMREDVAVCMARHNLGLGFWWEEEETSLESLHSMSNLMTNIDRLSAEQIIGNHHQDEEDLKFTTHQPMDQTLIPPQAVVYDIGDDDLPCSAAFNHNNEEEEVDFQSYLEQLLMNENHHHEDLNFTSHDQTLTIESSDTQIVVDAFNNKNNNEEEEMDYDNLFDYDTTVETLISNGVFQSHEDFDHFTQHLLMDDNHNHQNNQTLNPPHQSSASFNDDNNTCADEVSMMETTNPLLFSDLDFLLQDGPTFLTAFNNTLEPRDTEIIDLPAASNNNTLEQDQINAIFNDFFNDPDFANNFTFVD